MQPQPNFSEGSIVCAQCGAPMPREMRFCRSCGNRLGEGPAEYTETVRFSDSAAAARGTSPYVPGVTAPIASMKSAACATRRRRWGSMSWVWVAIVALFVMGGGMSMLKRAAHGPRTFAIAPAASRSYVGVDGFKTTDGGVTFDVVSPPDSPADKAGLVGGDIVTSFDGHAVKSESEI